MPDGLPKAKEAKAIAGEVEGATTVKAPFGTVFAQLLSLGRGLTRAFVYTDALPENTISATLHYRQGGGAWHELRDAIFPYEFSPPYTEGRGDLELAFEVETAAQAIERAPAVTLRP